MIARRGLDFSAVPTYSYACKDCGHAFDIQQAFSDDSLTTCPDCGGTLRKVWGSVGVVFKGSGFYRNDSRGKEPKSSGDSTSSDAGATKESAGAKDASSSDSSTKKSDSGDPKSGAGTSGTSTPAKPAASGKTATSGKSGNSGSKSA